MAFWRSKGVLLVTSALVAGSAVTSISGGTSRDQVSELLDPAAIAADAAPPLWQGLGTLSHPITTGSEQAQRYFNQACA
jgi:hypothetical protein